MRDHGAGPHLRSTRFRPPTYRSFRREISGRGTVYSDPLMLEMAESAANQGYAKYLQSQTPQKTSVDVVQDGVNFCVWFKFKDGRVFVGGAYPIEWIAPFRIEVAMDMYCDTFDSESDVNAAVKFSLALALADRMFDRLAQLLTEGSQTGGFGSDPGWYLERRVPGDPEQGRWPPNAMYRAFVEPRECQLGYPEGFYTREEFCNYVRAAINAFAAANPLRTDEVKPVLRALESAG